MAMYHAISSNANVLIRTYGPHCTSEIESGIPNLTAISGTCAVPTVELEPNSATSFVHHSEVKCIRATFSALVLSLARVRHQLQASLIFLYFVIVSTRNAQLRRAPAEGSRRLVLQQLSQKELQMDKQTRLAASKTMPQSLLEIHLWFAS